MARKNYRVMGIDVGYARLGIGVIDVQGNQMKHLDHVCIETHKDEDFSQRLIKVKNELSAKIDEFNPDRAVVEDLFFFKNQKTAIKVGQVRGVILLVLAEKKIETLSLTPLQIKTGVTNYGRAGKKQVQSMVKLLLGLNKIPKPDDAADALAAAISGSNIFI